MTNLTTKQTDKSVKEGMFKNFKFNTFSKWNYLWLWMFPTIVGIDKGDGDDKTVKVYFKRVGGKIYLTDIKEEL